MHLLAPAKINLHLRVFARGHDGFHPLSTWMCTVGLFDTIKIEQRSDTRPSDTHQSLIELTCNDATVPTDSRNLIVRAGEALARGIDSDGEDRSASRHASLARSELARVSIRLTKRIPAGGGLGGGSSDAARALVGLSRLWKLNCSQSQLWKLAASIGSDVPFFLSGNSSICTGRGEIIQPIAPPKPKFCTLILPAISSSTPAVYARFDEMPVRNATAAKESFNDWTNLNAVDLLPRLANDLEAPAYDLHPDLRRLHDASQKLLDRPVRMSGSGSTLFTLFDNVDAANHAAFAVEQNLGVKSIATELAPIVKDDISEAE